MKNILCNNVCEFENMFFLYEVHFQRYDDCMLDGSSVAQASATPCNVDVAQWKKLVNDAKALAIGGKVQQSLDVFRQALKIHWTEKLERRIKKLEVS